MSLRNQKNLHGLFIDSNIQRSRKHRISPKLLTESKNMGKFYP
jgi:hypothetical protein